jgi:hypothetical protein
MYNKLRYNNIQQKTGQAQNVTLPYFWVTFEWHDITDANNIMGHHGCQRYYGSKVMRHFSSTFPPAGRHTLPTMLDRPSGPLDQREGNYVQIRVAI